MKNLIKVIICALVIFWTTNTNQAQSNVGAVGESRLVIATSGLNMRKAPSLNASVVKLVRYGHEVQLINDGSNTEIDTIEFNKDKVLTGVWVKVSHRGDVGYMFSPFLAKVESRYFPTELVDENFALLFEGTNCFYNFQYRRGFDWTGIYKTVSGKFRSKKVNITYHTDYIMGHESYAIDTNDEEELLFIVGSKSTDIKVNNGIQGSYYPDGNSTAPIWDGLDYDIQSGELNYCHHNISYSLSDNVFPVSSIIWRGDLDDDGIDDFIISYGEKEGKIVLHLSSQAKAGELFKAVAEYYTGYCC